MRRTPKAPVKRRAVARNDHGDPALASQPIPADVKKAIGYLRSHLSRRVPISELVAVIGTSERTLHKHFSAFLGSSPLEYGLRLRLLAARQLLLTAGDSEPVTSVATRFGFTHFGRFSSQYRRAFGETPSATRRKAIDEAVSASRTTAAGSQLRTDQLVLAILPLAPPLAGPDHVAFAGALNHSIAAAFAGERQVSAMLAPPGTTQQRDIPARYLIRGQILSEPTRLRVVLALVDAADGSHLWGDSFDGSPTAQLALIDRVVAGTTRAVLPNIRRSEIVRAQRTPIGDANVRELRLRAWPLLTRGSPTGLRRALDVLYRAMELDPNDGIAAGMAAWAHAQVILQSAGEASDRAAATNLAARAEMLDADDPIVLTARCMVCTMTEQFDAATALIDRALAHDPRLPCAWERRGWLNMYAGEPKPALGRFARAIRLDQPGTSNAMRFFGIGSQFFDVGRYDLAVKWIHHGLLDRPDALWVNRTLAVAYARTGERYAADRALAAFRQAHPGATIASVTSALRFPGSFVERIATGLDDLGLPPN